MSTKIRRICNKCFEKYYRKYEELALPTFRFPESVVCFCCNGHLGDDYHHVPLQEEELSNAEV